MTYALQFGDLLPYWDVLAWGLLFTVVLTLVATVAGVAVGTAGAAARTFGPAWIGRIVQVYVELIRNTPFIVQLFFIFFGLPAIGLGLSIYGSGILALALWGGAYNVENVRGGFLAVPKGLREAARALGLGPFHYVLLIAVPVGLRVSIPAMMNTAVSVLKNSAYLQAIGLGELTFVAMEKVAKEFRTLEMFAAIGVLYLGLVLTLSWFVRQLEYRLQRPFRGR